MNEEFEFLLIILEGVFFVSLITGFMNGLIALLDFSEHDWSALDYEFLNPDGVLSGEPYEFIYGKFSELYEIPKIMITTLIGSVLVVFYFGVLLGSFRWLVWLFVKIDVLKKRYNKFFYLWKYNTMKYKEWK